MPSIPAQNPLLLLFPPLLSACIHLVASLTLSPSSFFCPILYLSVEHGQSLEECVGEVEGGRKKVCEGREVGRETVSSWEGGEALGLAIVEEHLVLPFQKTVLLFLLRESYPVWEEGLRGAGHCCYLYQKKTSLSTNTRCQSSCAEG